MFKFAVKVGLAGTAVYYLKEEGIWKESDVSLKTYDKINETIEPYVKDIKTFIPFELPQVPQTEGLCNKSKQYWNKGVSASFVFLSELPCKVNKWTKNGINAILENPNFKKLVESTPETKSDKITSAPATESKPAKK